MILIKNTFIDINPKDSAILLCGTYFYENDQEI